MDGQPSAAGAHNANPWWRRIVEDHTFRSEVTITMTRLVRQMERSYLSGELTANRHGQGHCEALEELSRVDTVTGHLSAATAAVFNGHRPEGFIASIQRDGTAVQSSGHACSVLGGRRSSAAPRRHNTRHTLQDSVLHATLPATFLMCTQVPVSSLSDTHRECLVPVLRAIWDPSPGGDTLQSRAYTHAWRPHYLPPYYVPLLGPQPTDARGEEVENFTDEIGRHHQTKRGRELHHASKANRFLRQSRALQALNRGDRPHTTDSDEDDDRGCLRTAYGSVPFEGGAFNYPEPTNHPPDIYTQPPLVDVMPPPGFVLTSWSEAETPLIVASSSFSPVELAGESAGSKDPSKSKFLPIEPLKSDTTSAGRSLCGNSAEANWVYRRWVGRQRDSIYSQVLQFIVSDLVGSGASMSNPSEGASAVPSGRYTNVSAVPLFNKLSNADRRLLAHYPSSLIGYDASLPRRLRTDLDPRTFGVKDGDTGDALFDFPTAVKTVHFRTPKKQWRAATGTRRVFTVSGKRQRIRGSSGASEKCKFEVSARAVFTAPPETDFYHRMHDALSTRVYEVPIVDVPLDRKGVLHDALQRKQDPHQTPSRPRNTVEKGGNIGSSYTSVASGVPPRTSPRIQPVSVHPPVPTAHECDRRYALAHNKPLPVLKGPVPPSKPALDRAKRPVDTNDDDEHSNPGAVCRAPLPPRFLGTIRPSMRLTRWHLWCDAIRQRYEEEVRQAAEADSSSRPPSSTDLRGDCPKPLSACKGKARVHFYETLLDGIPDLRAVSSPITAGGTPALSVAESPPLHGLGRFDLTVHRHDALYRSHVCRDAMRRLYVQRERDSSDAHMNKIGFIGFVLDLFNLFMPCNRGRYNIAMAEDEWRLYSAHVFQRDTSRDTPVPTKQVATAIADQLRSLEADQRARMHRGNAMRLGHTVLCHQPLASVPPEALLTSIDTGSEVVLPPYVGDFNSFYDFFFSIPLIMYYGEVVTEELYVGFWEFVHESWYGEAGTTNDDRYDRYLHRAELAPVVATVPRSRRAFLVNRMAETMEHTKRPSHGNSPLNTTADTLLLASTTSDDSEDSCQSDFPSLDFLERQKSPPVVHHPINAGTLKEGPPDIPPSLNPVALEARSAYSLFKQGGLSALNGEAAGVAAGDNMRIYSVPEYQRDELDNLLDFQSDLSSASSVSYSSDDEGTKNLPRGSYLTRQHTTDWDDTMSLSTAKGHRTRERYEALLRRRELIRRAAAQPDPIFVDESVKDTAILSTLTSDHVDEPVPTSITPTFSQPPASSQSVKIAKPRTIDIVAEVRNVNTTATIENADVMLAEKLKVLRSRQVNEGPMCVQPLQPSIDVPMDMGRIPDPTCRPRTSDRKVPRRTHLCSAGVDRLTADASFKQHPLKTPIDSRSTPTSARTPQSAIFFMSRPSTASRPNTASRPTTAPKPARRHRLSYTPRLQSSTPGLNVVDAPRVVPRVGSPRCLLPNTDFTSPAIKSGKCRTNRPTTTPGVHHENSPPPGPLSPSFLNYKNEDLYESEVGVGGIQTFWGSRQQGHFFKDAAGVPYNPSPHHCRLTGSSNNHVDVVVPKSITVTASGIKVRPPPRPSAALISLINKRHKATTPSIGIVQGSAQSRLSTPR